MRVAVIGAGAAGLCAAQHLSTVKREDVTFVVYEQTGNIGGTWVYTNKTTQDEYGLPIHSSMYNNLRTNLPKEIMEYPMFPFKHNKSYVSRTDVLQYLTDFTIHYDLKKYIKFYHYVLKVMPLNGLWEIRVKNLRTNEINVSQFDGVIVCNGHLSVPRFPEYPGMNIFRNTQMHSHAYREPEYFKGKEILIIGSGPSGIDITFDVSPFTNKVYFSHHNPALVEGGFPKNVIHKPDVKSLTENAVLFEDGSTEVVDVIIYCTGYNYSFPFLSKECGITFDDNFVTPLYKQLININNPTMIFIGIPWKTVLFPLFDLQVSCGLNALFKKMKLPSKEEMLQSLEAEIKIKTDKKLKPIYFHRLGDDVRNYMINLANTFNVTPVPEVIYKVYDSTKIRRQECLSGYREDVYEVKDSCNFVLHKNKIS